MFEEFQSDERRATAAIASKTVNRINIWIEERKNDGLLVSFLKDEKDRIVRAHDQKLEADHSKRLFISVELPTERIRKVFRQPDERKKIAGLAWHHGLSNVSISSVLSLERQLEPRRIDVDTDRFDLSSELPAMAQNEKQWAAKVALVEHELPDYIEFQGTSQNLVRVGTEPKAADLIGQLLGGGNGLARGGPAGVGRQLGLSEFAGNSQESENWWKKATSEAEREGFRGVVITRLKQDLAKTDVSVESIFFAKLQPGEWFEVTRRTSSANVNDQPRESMEQLKLDPQINKTTDTLGSLGLSVDRTKLDHALGHGAATQQAIKDAKNSFSNFLATYARRLDAPPVPVK